MLPPSAPLAEVAAVLEIRQPPAVERLYFWALQVGFADGGAAHLGLQWNARHPAGRAANWGGYGAGGVLLEGSASALPSRPGDPNTRDFGWAPGRPYRLRVARAPGRPGWWQGSIRDLGTGVTTVVRDLAGGGDHIAQPMVWSEVFARCDHPSTSVRWSGLEARTADGQLVLPRAVAVSYEPRAAGGCDNTDVRPDGDGWLQVTAVERATSPGALLPVTA